MESNVKTMSYYDKIEIGREPFKGEDWFEYLLTLVMDIVQDTELSKQDTKDLLTAIAEEM